MKQRRVCPEGHVYYKSSDCPVCPRCATESAPATGFLATLGAPARRALEASGLTTLKKLARRTESEVAELHGMGPTALGKLRTALRNNGMRFSVGRGKAPTR